MGHLAGKDIYRRLGRKIDGLATRAPWNDALRGILEALYSEEEADVVVKMPYSIATFSRVRRVTGYPAAQLQRILDSLCDKGLVMDLTLKGKTYYIPSPMAIGIFEFTMMRVDDGVDSKKMARLFHEYMGASGDFYAANLAGGSRISFMRTLPHEETLSETAHAEILDYEKAVSLVESTDRFSVAVCSCRHAKHHNGTKTCDVPLESCLSFGPATDYLVRRGFARSISRSEVLESLAASREMGLVFNADNVQKNATFICQCCGCCCHALAGISKHGYPGTIVTSSFIARVDREACTGCGKCLKACPIDAITLESLEKPIGKKRKEPRIDEEICLGCGVCALKCTDNAMRLEPRAPRVHCPETTFERIILQALEHGTLQNQLFDEPNRLSHQFLRGLVGGFLRLSPVKKALMSDMLRSRFLSAIGSGASAQGKGDVLKL